MKTLIFLLGLTIYPFFADAQTYAITQSGARVILLDNFTWRYADNGNPETLTVSSILIDTFDIATIEFTVNGNYLAVSDGEIIYSDLLLNEITYYDLFSMDKTIEGKIKSLTIGPDKITFEYYDSFNLDRKSIGRIYRISLGPDKYSFKYYDNLDKTTEGRIKSISKNELRVSFDFYDQFSMDQRIAGRLKKTTGNIPGVRINYLRAFH
jgi:hypothetical protein